MNSVVIMGEENCIAGDVVFARHVPLAASPKTMPVTRSAQLEATSPRETIFQKIGAPQETLPACALGGYWADEPDRAYDKESELNQYMKFWTMRAGVFAVGGALAMIVDFWLFPLWFESSWLAPINTWVQGQTEGVALDYWDIVWIHVPAWSTALIFGGFIGASSKGRFVTWAFSGGAGFVVVPNAYLLLLDAHPLLSSPVLWGSLALPATITGAWLTRHTRDNKPAGEKRGKREKQQ